MIRDRPRIPQRMQRYKLMTIAMQLQRSIPHHINMETDIQKLLPLRPWMQGHPVLPELYQTHGTAITSEQSHRSWKANKINKGKNPKKRSLEKYTVGISPYTESMWGTTSGWEVTEFEDIATTASPFCGRIKVSGIQQPIHDKLRTRWWWGIHTKWIMTRGKRSILWEAYYEKHTIVYQSIPFE